MKVRKFATIDGDYIYPLCHADHPQGICTGVCFDSCWWLWYNLWFHIMHFPLSFMVAWKCEACAQYFVWASCQIHKIMGCACAEMPGTFSPPPRVSDLDMHHGTCVTHVPWCMPASLTGGFRWSRWRVKRSRHSRCMRNLLFYASGKGSMKYINTLFYFSVASLRMNRSLWYLIIVR